ncbi:MAG: hypothetical protein ACXVNM_12055, partial [Bacteroidia bacterium]
ERLVKRIPTVLRQKNKAAPKRAALFVFPIGELKASCQQIFLKRNEKMSFRNIQLGQLKTFSKIP